MEKSTSPATACLKLALGEAHVWLANLERPAIRWPSADALDREEHERAARFAHERNAIRWSRSRLLLRLLLARYLGAQPAALRFGSGEHGKPYLVSGASETSPGPSRAALHPLQFNLAHSGAFAVYAVAFDQPVGVDVETIGRRRLDALAVARRAFGDETSEHLEQLDRGTRDRELLRRWVRHEAVLKCAGTGLADESLLEREPRPWVGELDVGHRAVAALALPQAPTRIECGDALVVLGLAGSDALD